jgi:hypothetical protein
VEPLLLPLLEDAPLELEVVPLLDPPEPDDDEPPPEPDDVSPFDDEPDVPDVPVPDFDPEPFEEPPEGAW